MSTPTVQCPYCYARQPAGPPGPVVCGSCEREFTPEEAEPPRKATALPVAKAAPTGGTATPRSDDLPTARPASSSRSRRNRDDEEDDRPRSRRRRRFDAEDEDDPPRKASNPALLIALIGGGAAVVIVLVTVAAVAVILSANNASAKMTGPVYVPPPAPMQAAPGPPPAEWPQPIGKPGDVPAADPWANPPGGPPPQPAERPTPKQRVASTNSNALVIKHQDTLKLTASSEWSGWPLRHLMDGDENTSWYSKTPDDTTTGRNPTVTLTFADDVKVTRVTILGNRDPAFPQGYTVKEGMLELLDASGKVLSRDVLKGAGAKSDFDLTLAQPTTARAVRFTMTKSETGQCGLAELLVE